MKEPVYFIIGNDKSYIARHYFGYKARDFVSNFYREWDGRITAGDALAFETAEEAERYLSWDKPFVPKDMKIKKYNARSNCLAIGRWQ